MASAVKATLNQEVVSVPADHRIAVFTALTTEGGKVAVAVKVAKGWDVNLYASKVWKHGSEAGIAFKGSL